MKPFQERLAAAKRYCEQATSLKLHPLNNTHANDVPVLMATFAAAECQELEAEVEHLKELNWIRACRNVEGKLQARLDAILSGERAYSDPDIDLDDGTVIYGEPEGDCPVTWLRLPEGEK